MTPLRRGQRSHQSKRTGRTRVVPIVAAHGLEPAIRAATAITLLFDNGEYRYTGITWERASVERAHGDERRVTLTGRFRRVTWYPERARERGRKA